MELKLFDLLGKIVKLVDYEGNIHIGCVYTFTPRVDNNNNLCEISILKDDDKKKAYVFCENEIKTIEVIK